MYVHTCSDLLQSNGSNDPAALRADMRSLRSDAAVPSPLRDSNVQGTANTMELNSISVNLRFLAQASELSPASTAKRQATTTANTRETVNSWSVSELQQLARRGSLQREHNED